MSTKPGAIQLAQRGVDHLVKAAQPIHVVTLFALWHLAHWQRPYSTHAEELLVACCAALRGFLDRPEFHINDCARAAAKRVEDSLWEIRHTIRHDGFRVPRLVNGPERVGFIPLLVRDFDNRDAAIVCASAGTAVPLDDFVFHEPAPYRKDALPTGQELEVVTELLLKAADFSEREILTYDRDPAILQELNEPLERPVTRKRAAART